MIYTPRIGVLIVLTFVGVTATAAQDRRTILSNAVVYEGAAQSQPFVARRLTPNLLGRKSLSAQWNPGDPIAEIPKRIKVRRLLQPSPPARAKTSLIDPLVDKQQRRVALFRAEESFGKPKIFADQPFPGANPPDTVGDVGSGHYVHMTNGRTGAILRIYDKVTGNLEAGPVELAELAKERPVGELDDCKKGAGDPVVLYDELAKRWLLSEFSDIADKMCVYISQADDPTTTEWFGYEFAGKLGFPDYPKFAVWPSAYFVASNESKPTVYAFDRKAMLAGQPASYLSFSAQDLESFGFQALQPADVDGAQGPPVGSPGYFLRHRDDEVHNPASNQPKTDLLELFEFHPDFSDASKSTFTGPIQIPISEIDSDLCGLRSISCFKQPRRTGTNFAPSPALDPLREVVMWRVQYRVFPSHESMVGSLVTDVNRRDRGGIRWFELRRSAGQPVWQLHQEGTFSLNSDTHNRFMPSIAMDKVGNIALGYSIVGEKLSAGIRYTGRRFSDPKGIMSLGEFILADGQGISESNRWGDYSSLNVDPVDGCTFWYTNQFADNGLYQTRVGTFRFANCL